MSGFRRPGALLGMMPRGSRKSFRKAVMTTSAPSIIQPEEADRLIDLIVDESKLWQQASVVRMETDRKMVRFIDLTAGILRPRVCGVEHDTASITATSCELHAVELVAQIPICDDVLDINLEGAELEQHILNMVAKVLANELEVWALMANTDGSYTSPLVNAATMALIDGWYKQLQGGHVLDAGLATDTSGRAIHPCKLSDLKKALPTKWRTNPAGMKFFMASDMTEDWLSILAGRQTGLGDASLTGEVPMKHGKSPIEDIPLLPTDLTNCSSGSFAPGNGTFMFYTDPANLVLGINREITYERWREGKMARTWHIWNLRADAKICVPDATGLYDCMQIGPCNDLYCQAQTCS